MMELILKIYSLFYATVLICNIFVMLKLKMFAWKIFLYEIFSASYLIFMIFAYFSESLRSRGGAYLGLPVLMIICVDIYTSIWHDPNDYFEFSAGETISEKDIELAKTVAILLAAPGYICGCLFLFEELRALVS